jgi:aspartyl protease family protein
MILLSMNVTTFSQLDLGQFSTFKLGDSFTLSKPKIKEMFSQKPTILKADFLNAYKIYLENVPFDNYGSANYTFLYVKEKLVSINIEFLFYATEKQKFHRLYNTILADIKKDKTKTILAEYSNLNSQAVFQYVEAECKITTPKDDINYIPINRKYLGQNVWVVSQNNSLVKPILTMWVSLGETHLGSRVIGTPKGYDGGFATIVLEVTNDQLQELKIQAENMSILNFSPLVEEVTQINLKFQNGVYYLPVIINHLITEEFTLDLGASDVSLSSNIFLKLYKSGTIQESDYIGTQSYKLADGDTATSRVFNLKSLTIGSIEIKDVRASISNNSDSPLLLGQSALKKLRSYRIDNKKSKLIIE